MSRSLSGLFRRSRSLVAFLRYVPVCPACVRFLWSGSAVLGSPVQAAEYVIGVFAGAYGIASGVDVAGIVTPLRHPFEADEAAGISLCFHLIIYGVCRIIAVDIDIGCLCG